jgi:hypothetical protein
MPEGEDLKGRRTHERQQLSIGSSPIMPWFEGINRPKDALKIFFFFFPQARSNGRNHSKRNNPLL